MTNFLQIYSAVFAVFFAGSASATLPVTADTIANEIQSTRAWRHYEQVLFKVLPKIIDVYHVKSPSKIYLGYLEGRIDNQTYQQAVDRFNDEIESGSLFLEVLNSRDINHYLSNEPGIHLNYSEFIQDLSNQLVRSTGIRAQFIKHGKILSRAGDNLLEHPLANELWGFALLIAAQETAARVLSRTYEKARNHARTEVSAPAFYSFTQGVLTTAVDLSNQIGFLSSVQSSPSSFIPKVDFFQSVVENSKILQAIIFGDPIKSTSTVQKRSITLWERFRFLNKRTKFSITLHEIDVMQSRGKLAPHVALNSFEKSLSRFALLPPIEGQLSLELERSRQAFAATQDSVGSEAFNAFVRISFDCIENILNPKGQRYDLRAFSPQHIRSETLRIYTAFSVRLSVIGSQAKYILRDLSRTNSLDSSGRKWAEAIFEVYEVYKIGLERLLNERALPHLTLEDEQSITQALKAISAFEGLDSLGEILDSFGFHKCIHETTLQTDNSKAQAAS